jgi:hypothetical protein
MAWLKTKQLAQTRDDADEADAHDDDTGDDDEIEDVRSVCMLVCAHELPRGGDASAELENTKFNTARICCWMILLHA